MGRRRADALRPPRPAPVGGPARRTSRSWTGEPAAIRRLRRLRPAADRRDRARGERRHRQDVHDRRASPRATSPRGRPLEELLLVTFTRVATGELRERVRERLRERRAGARARRRRRAARRRRGARACSRRRRRPRSRARRDRLRRALADFDAATIATTHGFCQEVLEGLGRRRRRRPATPPSSRTSATWSRRSSTTSTSAASTAATAPPFDRGEAPTRSRRDRGREPPRAARARATRRTARRRRCARAWREAVRDELERRKRRTRLLTYDDLLTRLDDDARATPRGAAACARLRERYRVVLVDEFQDTDPVQWEIVRRAFGGRRHARADRRPQAGDLRLPRRRRLRLPARGRARPTTRATLEVNWRSDQGLIDAYDALFGGAQLGHDGDRLPHRARGRRRSRRRGWPARRSTRRCASGSSTATSRARRRSRQTGYAQVDSTREHVASDLAADLVRAAVLAGARSSRTATMGRVRPGHVAVLVRTNRQAALVRDALAEVGRPGGHQRRRQRVRHARRRDEWLRLLRGARAPGLARRRAASAALTGFLGWTRRARRAGGRRATARSSTRRLHRLGARAARRRGVAALAGDRSTPAEGLAARVLAERDGERDHDRPAPRRPAAARGGDDRGSSASRRSPRGCAGGSPRPARTRADEERSRRLESDAEAVQVLTIHRSKGLEFPIVYCPFLWEPGWIPTADGQPVVFHDPDAGDERTHRRRRRRRPGLRRPPPPARGRAARRGPAPRLRRADPRPAPGGRVVGGLLRQPRLRRSGACCSRPTPTGNVATRGRGDARPTTRSWRAVPALDAARAA